ncbi:hypothetical protein GS436_19830 [Rhodococcus hoagii]|nr:hypothetical protein [Prescottella equi]
MPDGDAIDDRVELSASTTELFGVAQRAGGGTEAHGDAHRSDAEHGGKAIDKALDLFQFLMASQRLQRRDDTTPDQRKHARHSRKDAASKRAVGRMSVS